MLLCQFAGLAAQCRHVPARGDHFGFNKTLDGRTGRRERSQLVVAAVRRGVIVGHGTHGDEVGQIAGDPDGHGIGTGVARGGDDDDAGPPTGAWQPG